jgi:ribosomal protein S18 acetylase RimI-like enzyme
LSVRQEGLNWQVEEACLNAWPSPRHVLVDGYLLRAAGGASKRVNSVNPLRGAGEPEAAVASCEAIFATIGRRAIFRLPDIAAQMEPALERRGYRAIGETRTLLRPLDGLAAEGPPGLRIDDRPSAEWLAVRDEASGHDPDVARTFRTVTDAIVLPKAFVVVPGPDGSCAIGLGVRAGPLLVIESVAVPPALRNRGFGGAVVSALMRWGAGHGATGACLQVEANNAPAQALYRRLGFARELYRYHYRIKD